jgi:hemerythrin-like metal-binding protein
MRKYGYPQALAHKEQHDKLTAQVMNLQKRLRAGENTLSLSVMAFLKDWLEHHIAGSDQSYSAYIRGRRAA